MYHDKTAFPRTIVRVEWCCNPHAPFVHCVPFLVSSTQAAKNPCTDRNPWACCCCGHKQCLSRYGGYWRVKRVHPPTVLACSGSKTSGIAGRGGESGGCGGWGAARGGWGGAAHCRALHLGPCPNCHSGRTGRRPGDHHTWLRGCVCVASDVMLRTSPPCDCCKDSTRV